MDMANAAVKVPVTVLTAEVMEGPTAWPSVVARLRMRDPCRHPPFIADIDLSQTAVARKRRPFLGLRRPEWYALM